jgi:hypothetical protein
VPTGEVSKKELMCELEIALCLLGNLCLPEFVNAHLHLPHLLLALSVLPSSQMASNVTNTQPMTTTDAIYITLLFSDSVKQN